MFSVVVPVWNKRSTLRRTIVHALRQDYADFEIILVDDGSTDGSLSAIDDIADPRLRTFSQTNAGPGAARNRGIAEARHEWIAFLDADDLWFENHLRELARIRKAFPHAGLIGTRFVTSDRSGRFRMPESSAGKVELADYFGRLAAGEMLFFTSSIAAPAALLRKVGGFGSFRRGEDSDLWARIAFDNPVGRSTAETVAYIKGTSGITETIPKAWGSGAPACLADISPVLATVLDRLPAASSDRREALEQYIERYLEWTMQNALETGDRLTLRAISRLYRRPAPLIHRIVLAFARLRGPLPLRISRMILRARSSAERYLSGLT